MFESHPGMLGREEVMVGEINAGIVGYSAAAFHHSPCVASLGKYVYNTVCVWGRKIGI